MRTTLSGLTRIRVYFWMFTAYTVLLVFAGSALNAQTVTSTIGVGLNPYAVAVNPTTNEIYVAGFSGNTVTEIDGRTNTAITIGAGSGPKAIAVNPLTNLVYVANSKSATVDIIDGSTKSNINSITVGTTPTAVAVNSVTNKIYVANYGSKNVTVIDGATNATVNVTVGNNPTAIAVNPATNQIYVANFLNNTVSVIDGASNTVKTITVGVQPTAVAVNVALNRIYVTNQGSNSVTVITGPTRATTTVQVGIAPVAVVVNPVTNRAYVTNSGAGTVTQIDDDGTNTSTIDISAGSHPLAVAVNSATNQVYVANSGTSPNYTDAGITVIDGATDQITQLSIGTKLGAVAVNPITNRIYVAESNDNNIAVVDGAPNSKKSVHVGIQPAAVAINPVTNQIYVANYKGGTVTNIDAVANTVHVIPVGVFPASIAVNPVTNTIYVANSFSNTVSVIDGVTRKTTTVLVGSRPVAVAVNSVTNQIFVANQGTAAKFFADNSVTLIDGATNNAYPLPIFGLDPASPTPMQLVAIAVDPSINQIYVVNEGTPDAGFSDGGVWMLSGADLFGVPTQFFFNNLETQPFAVAVSPVDSSVYVASYGSNDVNIFDPTGINLGTVFVGTNPYALAVNPVTNQIYVANWGSSNLTVISPNQDPITLNYPTVNLSAGSNPSALAVNPLTNKVFVTNSGSNDVTIIDGTLNASGFPQNTLKVGVGLKPVAVAVNPTTNRVYVVNSVSNDVTVISQAAIANPSSPLTTQIQAVADSGTSTTAGVAIFATNNASPSFTAVAASGFAPNAPAPTALYYQLDTTAGTWHEAIPTGSAGTNPANYSFALTNLLPGVHTVYAYAVYGEATGSATSGTYGTGSSPQIGQMTAYTFVILALPSTTTLTVSANPQFALAPLTLRACVSPAAAANAGTITFLDGNRKLYVIGTLGNDCITYSTSALSAGQHNLRAVYSLNPSYSPSSANVNELIVTNLWLTVTSPVQPTYGKTTIVSAAFPGVGNVTFTVDNDPATAVTKPLSYRQILIIPRLSAGTHTVSASFTETKTGTTYNADPLTIDVAKAVVTVKALNSKRLYGGANPKFSGIVTGLIFGDGITASYTTTADATTQATIVTGQTYPIIPSLNDPNGKLVNYDQVLVNGALTINQASLLVIPLSATRPYGNPDPAFSGLLIGAQAADQITVTYTSNAAINSLANGSYLVSGTLNDPLGRQGNYKVTYRTAPLKITQAPLTVTADSFIRSVNTPNPVFTGSLIGALASDNLSQAFTTTATQSSPVGSYMIVPSVVDPNGRLSNYRVIIKNGTLKVTP